MIQILVGMEIKKLIMNKELKQQLIDAGYKGNFELSELIEACGEKFENLTLKDGKWHGNYFVDLEGGAEWRDSIGSTPEEAAARLWLEIKKK